MILILNKLTFRSKNPGSSPFSHPVESLLLTRLPPVLFDDKIIIQKTPAERRKIFSQAEKFHIKYPVSNVDIILKPSLMDSVDQLSLIKQEN